MIATVLALKVAARTADAEGFGARGIGELVAVTTTVRGDEGPPVSALVCTYLTSGRRRGQFADTTNRTYTSILGLFARAIGDPPISKLTARHIHKWYDGLACAPSTTRHRLSVVQTFLDWCVDRGHLRTNPAAKIKPPKQPRHMPRALSAEEIAKILAVCPGARCRLGVLLMCQMGLR